MSAAMELHVALSMRLDATEAYRLAHNYRAEVLDEAAGMLRTRAAQYPNRRIFAAGLRHGALALAKAAMGQGKSSPNEADATFFQPGHTYSSGRTTFRCEHLSAHPTYGERRAIGWVQQDGHFDEVRGLDPDDWALGGWTDVTEGGEAR